ncbi:MAG TPA: thiamine pyrophosphate-binding protein [Streptosporangiaceae bacterium]|nr:thiamine pyrophosphate-binding protein [Streptosporangiaceae bacterium]
MLVSDAVATALAELCADTVFGLVGSGNFHVTNALIGQGARFIAARHENGAASMADGWARLSGRPGVVSLHQGPGLTNALTAIAEAAKSRTPLLVLAADATSPRSNFRIDVAAIATAVGATPAGLHSPSFAVDDTVRAYRTAASEHRCVILALPLEVQAAECAYPGVGPERTMRGRAPGVAEPADRQAQALARLLERAERPVFIAGRGARAAGPQARAELERLADACGALLATSAAAKGLFRGSPWDLDVSGGFASPLAAELIQGADVLVGWGSSLNMWTLRHGNLVGRGTTVVQVDTDAKAIGVHQRVGLAVTGDVAATARVVADLLPAAVDTGGYRSAGLEERIAREVRWRDVPFTDESDGQRIDPRTLTIELDDLLPAERIVAVDSGNFMGYPSMYLSVPDADGFTFTQAYQSVGLGLSSAIGAAIARPDRLTVAALGDGGALMGISELETVVRLGLPMVIVVYDDAAYGAEVHHFGPDGYPLDTVQFPPADLAAIGRGFGCEGVTVRTSADLEPVRAWLAGGRDKPLVIDAKVTSDRGSWWLEEAFRGH